MIHGVISSERACMLCKVVVVSGADVADLPVKVVGRVSQLGDGR